MPTVYYGNKGEPGIKLEQSDDLIAVRTRSGRPVLRDRGAVAAPASMEVADGTLVVEYPDAGVQVYRVPVHAPGRSLVERKSALRQVGDVRFAGGVLVDSISKQPVLYTENLFVKFEDRIEPEACEAVLREHSLSIKEKLSYATNAYFVATAEGTGQAVFDIAEKLRARADVQYCHPELIRRRARKQLFPQQWHLKKTQLNGVTIDAHAHVEEAHGLSQGEGITIAIIDDGVDIDHPEFAGSGKVVAPRDATGQNNDPRPRDQIGSGPDKGDNHGTACSGVACANGSHGASGVAPKARLMPIRLQSGLGSQREADAFSWAAANGADVISCSWGPEDGDWWDANDPRHRERVPLPDSTRLAIENVLRTGRNGKGCVVLFAAGNGNESVDNDGYASNPGVVAVAACNDRGTRSVYSDFGQSVWCAFPSNDIGHAPFQNPPPLTPGIWTTDRSGSAGYNVGKIADGDGAGNFSNDFGGTSSACPGAAGVAALVLAINPALKWNEVKDLFRRACDRIDPQGGGYDASGHSDKYGFGRLNAFAAVQLARPAPRDRISVRQTFDTLIPDLRTISMPVEVARNDLIETVSLELKLEHTYIGDLKITVQPPPRTQVAAIVLHDRAGGSAAKLDKTYDSQNTPALARLVGKSGKGTWTLIVQDAASQDSGMLRSLTINLDFRHADRDVQPVPTSQKRASTIKTGTRKRAAKKPVTAKRATKAKTGGNSRSASVPG